MSMHNPVAPDMTLKEASPPKSHTKNTQEIVRVIRVLEFVGPRGQVEATLRKRQVRGTYQIGAMTIREAIVGDFPEVVEVTSKSETSV
jgi:hypothetical protein